MFRFSFSLLFPFFSFRGTTKKQLMKNHSKIDYFYYCCCCFALRNWDREEISLETKMSIPSPGSNRIPSSLAISAAYYYLIHTAHSLIEPCNGPLRPKPYGFDFVSMRKEVRCQLFRNRLGVELCEVLDVVAHSCRKVLCSRHFTHKLDISHINWVFRTLTF